MIDPNAKIILITSDDEQKVIQNYIDEDATSYVSKPFDFNSVLAIIKEILESNLGNKPGTNN